MRLLLCLIIGLIFSSCGPEQVPIPKPRIFPRVVYPDKAFENFVSDDCAFRFEKPKYAEVEKDTAFFDQKPKHSCWFDLSYPDFDARIHFSYYPINGTNDFEKLRNDAFVLAQKHNIKANYIDELPLVKSESIKGIIFQLEGAVASPVQFYLTDERNHFLRASLYFNTEARPDSLAPITEFIKQDISHLVNTFDWVE